MFETLIDDVKGSIEEKVTGENVVTVKGWAFSEKQGVCPLRCKYDGTIKMVDFIPRPDICDKYNKNNIILCGWKTEIPTNKYVDLQIKINNEWTSCINFNTNPPEKKVESVSLDNIVGVALNDFKQKFPNATIPSVKSTLLDLSLNQNPISNLWIVDNFYKESDNIRKIALNKPEMLQDINKLIPCFEKIMRVKLSGFDKYKNGEIISTIGDNPTIIQQSDSSYRAILFLTPNAPVSGGVTLYNNDYTPVDIIGNVYNRLVIFNSKYFYAISHNFGKDTATGRLIQTFAFDMEEPSTKISFNM